jgi:hypothetical protein
MQRFEDANGGCYLDKNNRCFMVRNNTQIHFGSSNNLIGTVVMTNPGSYGLNKLQGWSDFICGKGIVDILEGKGSPDLTMQNIIGVIKDAYEKAGKSMPDGYVEVINISSVVCPKGENVVDYHNSVEMIIKSLNLNDQILYNPKLTSRNEFEFMCQSSPFVILGFVKGLFETRINNIKKWSVKFPTKVVYSEDNSGWYTHPRRWRTESDLKNKAIDRLSNIV